MRKFALPFAAALTVLAATPAFAGEGRVELRTGVGWPDGQAAKAEIGGAAGYDWTMGGGSGAFFGVEQSVDKVLASGQKVRWGTMGRVGMHVTPNDKVYAIGGYTYGKGPDAPTVGAGWEHGFGNRMYGKVEYKKFFNEDGYRNSNAALVGVGMHF